MTPLIGDLIEREQHATEVMRDPKVPTRDQLAANKLIGTYEGDFGTQVESKKLNLNLNVDLSGLTQEQLERLIEKLEAGEPDDGAG